MSAHLIGYLADVTPDDAITSANSAWLYASSALVLLMTPGLAFFYGGMTRAKSTLNMIMMSFSSLGIVSVLWVLYGYSLAFSTDKGGKGLVGDLTHRFLHNESYTSATAGLYDYGFIAFQLMFAIITLALISGAVADRMKFNAWIVFSVLWITLIYFPVAHWVFAFGAPLDDKNPVHGAGSAYLYQKGTGGWIVNHLGAFDFAGGTAVHINAGAAGLALCLMLGVRKGFKKEAMRPHNLPLVMIGTGLLWFGWFGFNAGSALLANGFSGLAFINTQVATGSALLGWLVVEKLRDGHFTTLGAASGAVAGLVAITPACGSVSPSGSIVVGGLAGMICAVAIGIKNWLGFDDALDVVGVHLVGGLWGTLSIGLLATKATTSYYSDDAHAVKGLFYGGDASQLGKQALAAFAVMAYSFLGTLVIAFLLKVTIGLRVSEEAEVMGIDQAEHAETAYEFTPVATGGVHSTLGSPAPQRVVT